jgi:hypothetical protein
MGRRLLWGREVAELPHAKELKGDVVGALLLRNEFRGEWPLIDGGTVERWRLTDDLNALMLPDAEFTPGGSYDEVILALEQKYPSPVPGTSRVETWDDHPLDRDLLVHDRPLADSLVRTRVRNPDWNGSRWSRESRYRTTWVEHPVEVVTEACAQHGDLVVTAGTMERLKEDPEFASGDLVFGHRTSYYSLVRYDPRRARAREKGKATTRRKDQHAADLSGYANLLVSLAREAYDELRCELVRDFSVNQALTRTSSCEANSTPGLIQFGKLRALLIIHRALKGKTAYRSSFSFQQLLRAVRDRPADLNDGDWGNYCDESYEKETGTTWIVREAALPVPRSVRLKLEAKQKAQEEEERKARTCNLCGAVQGSPHDVYRPVYRWGLSCSTLLCKGCYDEKQAAYDVKLRTCTACGTVKDDVTDVTSPPWQWNMEQGSRLCHDCYDRAEAAEATAEEEEVEPAAGHPASAG